MVICKAVKEDVKNIASLAMQVWLDTYATEGIRDVFSDYIWRELIPEKFEEKFLSRDYDYFAVKKNNHLIGFAEMNKNSINDDNQLSTLEIDKLYIQENYCGNNIGSEIISFLSEYYKNKNYKNIWLTVYENNLRAIKFYKKNGFNEAGEYYFELDNEKHRNLIMLKDF